MAIVKFNPSFQSLRGKVGWLVFKHYAGKVVVTRVPTFSGQWSTAQQDGRKRFAAASAYARTVCADPVLRAKYERIAAHRGLTVRSAAISAYLQGKTVEIEIRPPPSGRRLTPDRAGLRRGFMPLRIRCGKGTQSPRHRRLPGTWSNKLQITAKCCEPPMKAGRDPPAFRLSEVANSARFATLRKT